MALLLLVALCGGTLAPGRALANDFENCIRGFQAAEQGYFDIAIHYCTKALRSGDLAPSQEIEVLTNRRVAYEGKRLFARADKDFDTAFSITMEEFESAIKRLRVPDSASVFFYRGLLLAQGRKYGRAIRMFDRVLELTKDDANAYYNRGLAYFFKGKLESTSLDFEAALRITPNHTSAHYNLGLSYYQMRRYDEAVASFSRAIEIVPEYAQAFHNRGFSHQAKGDAELARADFAQAYRLAPDDGGIRVTAQALGLLR
jgi:tetratricopeptide (TPR) repeat protein